jgi:Na+-transporting NADH:ubiquinone oxidoreductase subunit D
MKLTRTKGYQTLTAPLVQNNPISIQSLGICSALAVTVQLKTAIVMGLSLTFVLSFSNLFVSMLRKVIPRNVRMIVELSVIASLVILADEVLRAFAFLVKKGFVGVVNLEKNTHHPRGPAFAHCVKYIGLFGLANLKTGKAGI